jgi:hypothetical protein
MLYGLVFRSIYTCCSIALCSTGSGPRQFPSKAPQSSIVSPARQPTYSCVCVPVCLWERCLSVDWFDDRTASIRVKGIHPQSPNLQGIQYILVGQMPFKLDIPKTHGRESACRFGKLYSTTMKVIQWLRNRSRASRSTVRLQFAPFCHSERSVAKPRDRAPGKRIAFSARSGGCFAAKDSSTTGFALRSE